VEETDWEMVDVLADARVPGSMGSVWKYLEVTETGKN